MRTQKLAVTTIWVLVAASGLAQKNNRESLPTVTLRIENEARVDNRILRDARKEAIAMLRRAGVELIWADCGNGGSDWEDREPCRHLRGRNEFWMQITMDRPRWSPKETLGFADLANGDGSAGVYYPAVVALVRDARGDASQLLAAAMVHEVGHLILGAEHTHDGVMCANWSREHFKLISAGRFDFAPGQPKLLQIEVRRRASESNHSPAPTPPFSITSPSHSQFAHVKTKPRRRQGNGAKTNPSQPSSIVSCMSEDLSGANVSTIRKIGVKPQPAALKMRSFAGHGPAPR